MNDENEIFVYDANLQVVPSLPSNNNQYHEQYIIFYLRNY
jgi:hypothetical protein